MNEVNTPPCLKTLKCHTMNHQMAIEEEEPFTPFGHRSRPSLQLSSVPIGGNGITDGSEFTKYSNNTDYWDADVLDESLLRFTKFSHDVTHGYLMITHLKGVKKNNMYYLTDPVILCKGHPPLWEHQPWRGHHEEVHRCSQCLSARERLGLVEQAQHVSDSAAMMSCATDITRNKDGTRCTHLKTQRSRHYMQPARRTFCPQYY